ncbi:MAG TPA: hypothetical protein VI248_20325, partial [Kineosporiaceae bacterium]
MRRISGGGRLPGWIAVVLGSMLLCACAGSGPGAVGAGGSGAGSGILVTVDIYSGRENPSWRSSYSQARSVIECVTKSTATRSVTADIEDGGLGFRAFLLSELPASVRYQ